ncbi:MAG: hypothetical protein IJD43_13895, partial [Thermoguttaceae bacterium]|nr:hypothetical protein [Thermoguttaceae bacterium]
MKRILIMFLFLFLFTCACVLTVHAGEQKTSDTVAGAGARMVKTVDGIEYAFRWCPPGTFTMGSPEDEPGWWDDETQHSVTLTRGFWML